MGSDIGLRVLAQRNAELMHTEQEFAANRQTRHPLDDDPTDFQSRRAEVADSSRVALVVVAAATVVAVVVLFLLLVL